MKVLIALALCGVMIGCRSDRQAAQLHRSTANFPLTPGAKWTLSSGSYLLNLRVDTVLHLGALRYSRLTELSSRNTEEPIQRTVHFAENDSGNILRLCVRNRSQISDTSNSSSIWYRFNVDVGNSWLAMANAYSDFREVHKFRITLISRSEIVNTLTGTYPNCYRFLIDDLSESDSEYYDWVAPGTGLVKRLFGQDTSKAFVLRSFDAPH